MLLLPFSSMVPMPGNRRAGGRTHVDPNPCIAMLSDTPTKLPLPHRTSTSQAPALGYTVRYAWWGGSLSKKRGNNDGSRQSSLLMLEGVSATLSPIGSNDDVNKLMLDMVRAGIVCVMISP
jgi:hypothetical protein